MWIIFELSINVLQAFLMLKFMKSRLHISKPHRLYDILCMVGVTSFLSLYELITIPTTDALVFIIPLLYAFFIADDKWYISLFWTLVLCLMFSAAVSLSLHIFMSIPQISYNDLMADRGGRIVFVLVTNMVLFVYLHLTGKLEKEISTPAWSALLLFMAMIISLFIVEEAVFSLQMELTANYSRINEVPFFLIYIGVLACISLCICLFHMMSQSAARENRYKIEANAMALSQQHMEELKRMYADLQSQRHDFKLHVQVLEEMVTTEGNAEATNYLAAYKSRLAKNESFLTGCMTVDALLTVKYLTMKKNNLPFKYTAYPLNDLPIDETDFCSIVGNVLDNAIEGSLRVSDAMAVRPIHLTFSRSWDMFYLFCTNSCNASTIRKSKNGWLSSKEQDTEPGMHAIGIHNIEKIVTAAEGRCTFSMGGDLFSVKIVLPYVY
ncbi:MAG: GHKL domain-containing protein [Clostridia bacterium]